MTSIDTQALTALASRLKEDARVGRLKLPTLPDVASRIREVLHDEGANANRIAHLVQLEPSLTARLLQVANSARYLGSHRVGNVRDAIARLGIPAVRNLATALSLHSAFRSRHPQVDAWLDDLWAQSCRVGALASVLASITPGLQADKAMLGGLVHDIGSLTLVPYLAEYPSLLDDRDALDLALGRLRARLGGVLLKAWRFDDELLSIPEQSEDWLRETPGAPDYVDVVLVARVHARFGRRKGGGAMLQSLGGMPAFLKFPISRLGPDASVQLIEEAQEEIAFTSQLLHGR